MGTLLSRVWFSGPELVTLRIADDEQTRLEIAKARHEVYAQELKQYTCNRARELPERGGHIIVALTASGKVAGFVSLTPPPGPYGLHRHVPEANVPEGAFEVRALTVMPRFRGRGLALALCYAACRLAETLSAHGSPIIIALGREELLPAYQKMGLRETGPTVAVGGVRYNLMLGKSPTTELFGRLRTATIEWRLPFEMRKPAAAFHGGAFFEAIGTGLTELERRHNVVSADVLDAWFPPAPEVVTAIKDNTEWLIGTSPPADCAGVIAAVARARRVDPQCLAVGAGSSDLIFRCFQKWLNHGSLALVVTPTYSEYMHVLRNVIRCTVHELPMCPSRNYALDVGELATRIKSQQYDIVVIVNPNSPTGRHHLLQNLPVRNSKTIVWVDETYIDYAGVTSLEREAATLVGSGTGGLVVCKSLSKAYALSGARAGYICGPAGLVAGVRACTPPWVLGLPTQVAVVRALADNVKPYYRAKWAETAILRHELETALRSMGLQTVMGALANFVLVPLDNGAKVQRIVRECRNHGVYLRDVTTDLGSPGIRVAVKDPTSQRRVIAALEAASAKVQVRAGRDKQAT